MIVWLSQNELLLSHTSRVNGSQNPRSEVRRWDLRNGSQIPLDALNHWLTPWNNISDESAVSPDSKWMLLYNFYKGIEEYGPHATVPKPNSPARRKVIGITLDGAHQITFFKQAAESNLAWLPDNRHLIEWQETDKGTQLFALYDMQSPQAHTILPVVIDKRANPPITLSEENTLGVTAADHLLLSNWTVRASPDDTISPIFVYDIDLRSRPVNIRQIRLPLPRAEIEEIALSPDGGTIAWKFFFREPYSRPNLLQRLLAYLHHQNMTTPSPYSATGKVALWISRADGSDLHEIGHINQASELIDLAMITWLPDGKSLSFIYQDALYIVPAD